MISLIGWKQILVTLDIKLYDEIVADMIDDSNERNEESSDEEIVNESNVSASEAFQALEVTRRWLEQQHADPNHLLLVTKWRDEASRIRSQAN